MTAITEQVIEAEITGPFIARTNVLHRVAVMEAPYRRYLNPDGSRVATYAIAQTVCGKPMQGVPLDGPVSDDDRICKTCGNGSEQVGE